MNITSFAACYVVLPAVLLIIAPALMRAWSSLVSTVRSLNDAAKRTVLHTMSVRIAELAAHTIIETRATAGIVLTVILAIVNSSRSA